MIESVEGLERPLEPGGSRMLTIWSTFERLHVGIVCYVDPPGTFQPCPECGVLEIESGRPFPVQANRENFMNGGELRLEVSEPDGTETTLALQVTRVEDESPPPLMEA